MNFSHQTDRVFMPRVLLLTWGAAGLVVLLALIWLSAPVWAHSLFLLIWAMVWGVCIWRDTGLHAVQTPASTPLVVSAESTELSPADHTETCMAMSEVDQEALRYALSHDLRAPLRVVDGFARILKEDYARSLDKMGNDHLDRILAASSRMSGMIDAILEQAQLSSAPLARQSVDLSAMAHDVAEELRSAGAAGVDGVCVACAAQFVVAEGLFAEGDPQLLRRVLENLMGNALKYSGKVDSPRIEVGQMPATNPAVYFVRDNGAGFDMQHADKLFGLFQRLHSAREFPGTGVGLAGVKNIIARHGGRVWAEAQAGQGACFYFTLISVAEAQQKQRAGAARAA
ncbi:ATP-binding protein [Aquabacterium sp.]|uniref:sensor histidine kinase n=1 Tax=Aquabacterium sp. TaxID=1872578 RepID=UPI0035B22006